MLAPDTPDPSAKREPGVLHGGHGFSFQLGGLQVAYSAARPHHVTIASSGFAQELFLPGGCDTKEAEDVTLGLVDVSHAAVAGGRRITWRFRSSLWDKQVHLLCRPDGCEYRMELSGTGRVDTLHLFEGLGPHVKDNLPVKHLNDKRSTPYTTAKSLKPDCLVIGQSPNPYFADTCDMVRIGPCYTPRAGSVIEEMAFRARMARLADPDWLIDMDGWPMPSLAALLEYLQVQVELGVPSLYYSTHIDTTGEPLTPDAYRAIRLAWRAYAKAWGCPGPDGGEEAGVAEG